MFVQLKFWHALVWFFIKDIFFVLFFLGTFRFHWKDNFAKVSCKIQLLLIWWYLLQLKTYVCMFKINVTLIMLVGFLILINNSELMLVIAWSWVQLTESLTSVLIFWVLWTRNIWLLRLPRVKVINSKRNRAITV